MRRIQGTGQIPRSGKERRPMPIRQPDYAAITHAVSRHKDSPAARTGVECLLNAGRQVRTPSVHVLYGTDFRKLKAPFIWYDILHVADVLSQFDFTLKDNRFIEMRILLMPKPTKQTFYAGVGVESLEGWDFGQKKILLRG